MASSAGWRDVAMKAVFSAYRANLMWWDGKGMLIYTEEHGGNYCILSRASPHATMSGCG